jgi:hypothetical protein
MLHIQPDQYIGYRCAEIAEAEEANLPKDAEEGGPAEGYLQV